MGYDLHITRRKQWSDTGSDIAAEEWLAYVQRDSELRLQPESGSYFAVWNGGSNAPWLDWADGRIYAKNPDAALMEKMVAIARSFDATVQGDDGEVYDGGSAEPRQPEPAFGERVANWFGRFRSRRPSNSQHEALPFDVGDKVRDVWGNEHTVTLIDAEADHGLGRVRTRRADGTELNHALAAHGLTPIKTTDKP